MFKIEPLQEKNIRDYIRFTYPWLRGDLKESCLFENKVVLAASNDSIPVGLIVAQLDEKENLGRIQSLFVVSSYRQRGLGTSLLHAAEKELRLKGCSELRIYFPMEEGQVSPLLQILQKDNWTDPVKKDEIFKYNVSSFSWIHRISLQAGEIPVPWEEITPSQLQYVKDGAGVWYSAGVSPFHSHLLDCRADTSFWLERNGQIIGWAVTVQVASDTLSYERFYIMERLQGTGIGIRLLAHIFKKQLSLGISYGSTMINYDQQIANQPLIRFYENKVKPFTVLCKGYYNSNKIF